MFVRNKSILSCSPTEPNAKVQGGTYDFLRAQLYQASSVKLRVIKVR